VTLDRAPSKTVVDRSLLRIRPGRSIGDDRAVGSRCLSSSRSRDPMEAARFAKVPRNVVAQKLRQRKLTVQEKYADSLAKTVRLRT
jgi:hypothetical protein